MRGTEQLSLSFIGQLAEAVSVGCLGFMRFLGPFSASSPKQSANVGCDQIV